MAVNDIVSPRIAAGSPSLVQPQPPHYGIITAEDAGPPLVETVLWDEGFSSAATADAAPDFNLDVIEAASALTLNTYLGKYALRIAPGGPTAGDPAGGTSREFSGTVVAVYRRTPLGDAPGSGSEYLVLHIAPDVWMEDLAANFAVLPYR